MITSKNSLQLSKLKHDLFASCASAIFAMLLLIVNNVTYAQNSSALEEIIVTAQKRKESLQDIPMSINAISGKALQELNLTEFNDLQLLVPGLELAEPAQLSPSISIRGLTNAAAVTGVEPVVETYWNGLPIRSEDAFGAMYDIERTEVMRGPQGALQGRPAPGGIISITTRKPDVDQGTMLDGTLQGQFTDDGDYRINGGVSVRLIPGKLALRLAGQTDEDDGPTDFRNFFTGNEAEHGNHALRGTLVWVPTEAFQANVIVEHNQRRFDEMFTLVGDGVRGPIDGYDVALNLYDYGTFDRDFTHVVTTLEWNVLGHQLSSVTGYGKSEYILDNDFDYSDLFIFGFNNGALGNLTESDSDTWTQEVRLASIDSGFWEYMVGVYYLSSSASESQIVDARGLGGFFSTFWQDQTSSIDREQLGLFTHHRFNFTDKLRLQLGFRWQSYEDVRSIVDFQLPQRTVIPGTAIDISSTADAPTWSGQVSYDFRDDVMGYVSYQRSYRPAGRLGDTTPRFDERVVFYPEETSDAIELGAKTTIFDGRLQLNVNLYRQEFNGLISTVGSVATDGGLLGTAPDGIWDPLIDALVIYPTSTDALAQGVELEWKALLTDNWQFSGNLAHNEVKFESGTEIPCSISDGMGGFVFSGPPALFATCDVSGQRNDSSEWTLSLISEYAGRELLSWADWYVRGFYSFRDGRTNGSDPVGDIAGYGVLNGFAGLRDKNGVWEASVWAKNLTDKRGVTARITGATYHFSSLIPERTVGLSVSYNFSM